MLGLNKVFIMGNLTRDPELRYTPNGQAVASFAIATNRRWNTPEGERREEAEFHNVVVWGKPAETINQYIKKGNPLFIEGRLKTQNWEGPDGVKRQRTEIIVESFQFIGGGSGNNTNTQSSAGYTPNQQNSYNNGGNMPTPQDFGGTNTPNDTVPENNASTTSDNPFADQSPKSNSNPEDISIDDIPF